MQSNGHSESPSDIHALYRAHVARLQAGTARALDRLGYGGVVIHAGRVQSRSPFDDADWPFRPVPMFTHWSPLEWPDSAVVVGPSGARLWAVRSTGFWERPAEPDWTLLNAGLPVEAVDDFEKISAELPDGRVAFIGHEVAAASALGISDTLFNPADLVVALEDERVAKTPYEVRMMAEASRFGALGHRAAAEAFLAGDRSELQIHLKFLQASRQDDADTPYKGIVALGEAAATLHHNTYQDRPGAGSLLIDAGARHNGYPSDITRTYVAHEAAAGAHREFDALIAALDRLQLAVIEDIRVGMNYEALHDQCHRRLGELMVDQGLVTCSAEAATAEGITRAFFPHGLGHSIGVQVHDVSCRKRDPKPENPFLRHTADISPGQVFTIEPGFYFIDALLEPLRQTPAGAHVHWDKVKALAPFGGIRIEDNIFIEADGARRNLTREAFSSVEPTPPTRL